jgi:hypothetical protein
MPRKTAEERAREYDDAKARQPKVLMHRDVVVPEFTRNNEASLQQGADHISNNYTAFMWFVDHRFTS